MTDPLAKRLVLLPRPIKRLSALCVDGALCVLAVWLALSLRYEQWVSPTEAQSIAMVAAVALALPLFIMAGFYRAIFRYTGASAGTTIVRTCLLYFGAAYALLFSVVGLPGVPRSTGAVVPLLVLLLVGGSRALVRYWLGGHYRQVLAAKHRMKVVIYGAGGAGRQLAAALAQTGEMTVRAYIDDAPELQGRMLDGLHIRPPEWLAREARRAGVTDVLLAMPSVSRARKAQILNDLVTLHFHVRMLPAMTELAEGKVRVNDLMEVDIEDLLGRDPVPPVADLMHRNIREAVVLVTGAGGSIGSELCRQIVRERPEVLLLVDHSEFALYAIHQELLKHITPPTQLIPLLASVCDEPRMRRIMQTWTPRTVYHAAAYKHVPLVEHNPVEGLRNNALGTLTTARLARQFGVGEFVLVSTDKAVRPTNIMGATKRLSELVLQGLAQLDGATCFSMVRFGNVLGSSGSVVPLFRQQIAAGGPITLTDLNITRYFMTIPEAAQLVIQAGSMARGGEVFVLDMGQPVRIGDLARRIVELSGRTVRDAENPHGDIELKVTGLRPGEKLFEELLIEDNALPTAHPRVMRANEPCPPWHELEAQLAELAKLMAVNDVKGLKRQLAVLLPGYKPHPEVVDWVVVEQHRSQAPRPLAPAGAGPAVTAVRRPIRTVAV